MSFIERFFSIRGVHYRRFYCRVFTTAANDLQPDTGRSSQEEPGTGKNCPTQQIQVHHQEEHKQSENLDKTENEERERERETDRQKQRKKLNLSLSLSLS